MGGVLGRMRRLAVGVVRRCWLFRLLVRGSLFALVVRLGTPHNPTVGLVVAMRPLIR
jgi:hypothetical protein